MKPLVFLGVTCLSSFVWAKSSRTFTATYDAAWSAAVRYVRVDRSFVIRDRDRDAGYVLFEWESEGKKHAASVELAKKAAKDKPQVTVFVRCDGLPSYEEVHFLDRLEQKLKEEGGGVEEPERK